MAAAGGGGEPTGPGTGGKIRSRRYHLSSGRAPYSKSRQQQGIISRVTDTVKSIVPGWLQKYFNKQEEERGRAHNASEVIVNDLEGRENSAEHHIYVEDEGNSATDGRVTPEPIIDVDEEVPSTSQSAVGNTDALTRPSLHRASLNFNIFDSPGLNCQPSTSSTFPIGTSGFSLVKEIKDSTSQHDDDNISTTSGFSSRASDKDLAVSKNVSMPPLWSPEVDRSQSLSHNSSMTSKKPTFNLSAFSSLSPSLGNTSIANSQLGDSPFYPGKTTYQGAAAVRSSRVRSTPYQAPLRRQVKAKPAHSQQYGVTSSAARRILQSLEKMSSPLADAKRIPSSSSLSHTPEKTLLDIPENPSKRKKVESPFPPVQRLVTPKSISVSTNRSLYIKPSLTPSAVSNTNSRSIQPDKHNESKQNSIQNVQSTSQSHSFSYPKFSTPASNGLTSGTGGGKMMREKGSHYSTKPAHENLDAPYLPEIPLPLSTAALPSFKFSTLSSTATSPISATKPADSATRGLTSSSPLFTFSSPIVKSTESNAQSPGSPVDFTFSVPTVKVSSVESNVSAVSSIGKMHVAVNNSSTKNTDDEQVGFCKPAKTLKEGSVLDMLRNPGFSSSPSQLTSASTLNKSTPTITKTVGNALSSAKVSLGVGNKQALGIWQCSACFHENRSSDSNCIACSAAKQPTETSKKLPASPPSSNTKNSVPLSSAPGLGDLFKLPAGTWNCDTCLVQNKAEVTKCVACETPKPGTGIKATLLTPSTTKAINPATNTLAFASCSASISNEDICKKPMGSWECTSCHVQNKTEDNACVGCSAEKPGTVKSLSSDAPSGLLGLLDQFKKPAGSWDCDVCLIQNKPEATRCVACESAKPGTKAELKATPLSSGQMGLLDQFKKSAGSWDCEVCLVENKPEAAKCVACESAKPGTNAELKGFGTSTFSSGTTAPTFKFGVQPSDSTAELKSGEATGSKSGFSFAKPVGDFKFGLASASTTEETGKKSFTFASSTSNPVSAGFKFGVANPAQTKADTPSQSSTSGFIFGSVSNTVSLAPAATSSGSSELQVAAATGDANLASTVGLKSTEEKKAEAPTMTPFTFGKTEQNKETLSTFVFGKKDEQTDSAPTGSSFVFGVKKDGEEQKPFLFGKSEPAKDSSKASVGFTFAASNPTEKKDDQHGKSVFAFSAQTSNTDAGASKQPFSFQTSGSSTAASSSSSSVSSGVFGAVAQSGSPANPTHVFGGAISANAPAASSGVFGNVTPSNAPAASSTLFGNVAPSSTPSSGSSALFGSSTPSSAPASSSSLFGTAAKLSAPVGSGGVFNSAAPAAPASTSTSVFGTAASSTNTSGNSANIFGNSSGTSSAPGAFVFGQTASTASTVFGNSSESKSSFAFSGQENKPVTSASTSATPFVFGAASANTTPAAPSFNFGQTNASNLTGTSSSPFIFGTGSTGPASSSLIANPVPAFGQSTNPSTAPAFGSSTLVFPAGNPPQVPAFGSSSSQPPVFGQQTAPTSFGSSAAPSAGSGFQFGNNANFNFTSTNSSSGVFTFNANSESTTQPPAPGFMFNAVAPGFNKGTNGRSTPASAISNRKIKTARRRK